MAKISRQARELEQARARIAELEQEVARLNGELEQATAPPRPAKKAAAPKTTSQ